MQASPAAGACPGPGAGAGRFGRAVAGLAAGLVCALLLLACIGFARPVAAQQAVPELSGRVVDTTGTLDAAQRAALEAQLEAIEQRDGSQVAVLLVPSTEPEPIEAFSIRVAEQWQLGRADVDDGALLVVAMRERRMRIEVGYGLEGAIPDAIARRIIAEQMAPRFQAGDFAGGLEAAVAAIGAAIAGEGLPPPAAGATRDGDVDAGADWLSLLLFAAFAGFILTRMFGVLPGAMLGGAGGGFLAIQAGVSLVVGLAAGLVLFFLLLLFGAIGGLGRVGAHTYRSPPPPVIFPGGRRGGGFGGGGFGRGGFGGGGGGFGGGGASGGW